MYCPKCRNKLPDGVSTCENCGWSEDAGIQTSKATTKPSPKKVIIAIIAVLVILAAAFGIRMFGSTPAKKDDPAIKICGEWQSKKAGVDINTSNDLMDYKKATVTFSTDGTGTMDTLSDGINLNYTWRYCAEETEKLGDGSLVYEVTFEGVESKPVYAVYKDETFMMSLPKTGSSEVTIYFVRASASES